MNRLQPRKYKHLMNITVQLWPERQWSSGPEDLRICIHPEDEILVREDRNGNGGWLIYQGNLFQLSFAGVFTLRMAEPAFQ